MMAVREADYSGCPMALAVEHALSADAVDDFDWTFVSADGLGATEAWALATTWLTELQGLVGIAVDKSQAEFTVVPNYEWVELELSTYQSVPGGVEERIQTAVAMHAASTVWRALASCRGFGPQEHAVFWKRLFDTIHQKPDYGPFGKCGGVTDENRFFEGVVFPRFKLMMDSGWSHEDMEQVVRIYCGLEDASTTELSPSSVILRQLEAILSRLGPILQTNRVSPVELMLRVKLENTDEARLNDLIDEIQAHRAPKPDCTCFCRTTALLTQPIVVKAVDLVHEWPSKLEAQTMEAILGCGVAVRTMVAERGFAIPFTIKDEDALSYRVKIQTFLYSVLNIAGKSLGAGVRYLKFRHQEVEESLPAICSALPHTRSTQTFEISSYDRHTNPLDQSDFAWICYALFHPNAAASTWRRFILTRMHYETWWAAGVETLDEVLAVMAKGNNLHVVLGHNEDRVDGYYTATIREGAVIYEEPGEDRAVVEVLETSTQMDVCVSSTDVTKIGDWVFVVLVGFGEAWVHSSCIDTIVFRPPERSALTGLSVKHCSSDTTELAKLVVVAGGRLEHLHVREPFGVNVKWETMRDSCPQLQSLSFSLPSSSVGEFALPPSLRELKLGLSSGFDDLVDLDLAKTTLICLHQLISLRIETHKAPTDTDVSTFIQPLLRALPGLQRFYWIDHMIEYDSEVRAKKTYMVNRSITRSVLHRLEFGRDDMALLDKAPTSTIVSLLSVVDQRHRDGSAIGLLSRDLIALISKFVGTTVTRALWVDGGRHRRRRTEDY